MKSGVWGRSPSASFVRRSHPRFGAETQQVSGGAPNFIFPAKAPRVLGQIPSGVWGATPTAPPGYATAERIEEHNPDSGDCSTKPFKTIHPVLIEYSCGGCKQKFDKKSLNHHLRRQHLRWNGKTRIERFLGCKFCSKTCNNLCLLKIHQKQHDTLGKSAFNCTVCHKGFMSAIHLKSHVGVHTEERPYYHCQICSMPYKRLYSLQCHHQKQHSGEPFLSCQTCFKGFCDQRIQCLEFSDHGSSSTDAPYKCHVCSEGFTNVSAPTTHARILHGIPNHFSARFAPVRSGFQAI